jgi:hypothetical protein
MGWRFWQLSMPMTTVVRMRDLMGVLQADNPANLDYATLSLILAQSNRSECSVDGWGHPFEIERVESSERKFRIRSLGRDGIKGPCCRSFVDSWDDDVVLEGDVWLQQWRFGHPRVGLRSESR